GVAGSYSPDRISVGRSLVKGGGGSEIGVTPVQPLQGAITRPTTPSLTACAMLGSTPSSARASTAGVINGAWSWQMTDWLIASPCETPASCAAPAVKRLVSWLASS